MSAITVGMNFLCSTSEKTIRVNLNLTAGVVMRNEIKLKPGRDWDKRNKKWRCIVDYREVLDNAANCNPLI